MRFNSFSSQSELRWFNRLSAHIRFRLVAPNSIQNGGSLLQGVQDGTEKNREPEQLGGCGMRHLRLIKELSGMVRTNNCAYSYGRQRGEERPIMTMT